MKKAFIILSSIIIFFAGFGGAWFYNVLTSAQMSGPLQQTKIIVIERGMGVSAIAQKLEDENVILSALAFKIIAKLDHDKRPLKAGEYEFTQNISLFNTLDMLKDGKFYDRKITFPEGITVYQIIENLKSKTDLSGDILTTPEEGSLLPDTYHYVGMDNRAGILASMKTAMDKTLADLWPKRLQNLPFENEQQALTLASIVEKETGVGSERARIAGVFINRLRAGMPLQSDPTVIYAITKGNIQNKGQGPLGRRLLSKDLEIESPYNTYVVVGLPPTPIANPGRAAIMAVLHPETHDYLYFVADGTGGHVFAKTLAEHNSNVARWRQVRKSQ